MRLSQAAVHALHGLGYLADQPAATLVSVAKIGRQHRIPEKHLAKIFQSLTKSGVLRSGRGVNGGFALAREAKRISLLEVIHILDGDAAVAACRSDGRPCTAGAACPIRRILRRTMGRMADDLLRLTVADLGGRGSPS
jgi:Rrf2 family protein